MFGHDALPTQIYSYKAYKPSQQLELVHDQLYKAHKYRNVLVALELERREAVRLCTLQYSEELQGLQAQDDQFKAERNDVETEIKTQNSKQRKRLASPELRAKLKAVKAKLRAVWDRTKAVKAAAYADPAHKLELAKIDKDSAAKCTIARNASELYWGTYLAVDHGMQRARKSKYPPKFRSWPTDGRLGLQLQRKRKPDKDLQGQIRQMKKALKQDPTNTELAAELAALKIQSRDAARSAPQEGLTVAKAFSGTDSRLKLQRTADPKIINVLMRVGSEGPKKTPVFACVPTRLIRPFPSGVLITWVHLYRSRVATHDYWEVQFTLGREEGWPGPVEQGPVAGIDVGWRLRPEGLRVAYLVGENGQEEELLIPQRQLDRWISAAKLRSWRDKLFDEVRPKFAAWLKANEAILPDWLVERCEFVSQWKAQRKLAAVVIAWRAADRRFAGDEGIFVELERWRKQDRKWYECEVHALRRAVAWRTWRYRTWAARFSQEYGLIGMEGDDWKDYQPKPDPDNDVPATGAMTYGQIAAVGSLRACVSAKVMVSKHSAAYTTQICHVCGARNQWDAARQLLHTCVGCGTTWDQDANAAANLRDLASEGVTSIV